MPSTLTERKVPVLTNGFVATVNTDQPDITVVNAARVSFRKRHTEIDPVKDRRLIDYLARNGHWTPFAHCRYLYEVYMEPYELMDLMAETPTGSEWKIIRHDRQHTLALLSTSLWQALQWGLYTGMKQKPFSGHHPTLSSAGVYICDDWHYWPEEQPYTLHIKMPVFVARQFMRSNGGIVYNETSRRYVADEPECYEPPVWRGKPTNAKQGSSDIDIEVPALFQPGGAVNSEALMDYAKLLELGVAPEMARMVLPQSMFTEVWMTASLRALKRFYKLRSDPHAQWEIRKYAQAMANLIPEIKEN